MKTRKHICEFTRSKPTATVDTCYCGKFRHNENNTNPVIVEQRAEHTPTPWNTDGENIFYCSPQNHDSREDDQHIAKVYVPTDSEGPEQEGLANAEFIVRAVNSHEELIQMIKTLREAFYVKGTSGAVREAFASINERFKEIAKAEGR